MSRVRRYSRSGPTAQHPRSPTGLSPPAVTRSSGLRLTAAGAARRLPPPPAHSSNPPQASPAGYAARGVWAPPRSLAATEGILSVPRGTEMFQFPRCPPRDRSQVPGRAPGGLPHSDIPGSQAASASPGHFAAWPRPSSAANAKASTMRPSCGFLLPFPSWMRRAAAADRRAPAGRPLPARAPPRHASRVARMRPGRPLRSASPPRWRAGRCAGSSGVAVMCFCDVSMQCARAIRHRSPADRPIRLVRLPRPQNPAGSAWRIVKVPMSCRRPSRGRPSRSSRGRQTSSEAVVSRPRTRSPTRWRSLTAAGACWPRRLTPGVEPRGFEPRTSAVQGRRSPG